MLSGITEASVYAASPLVDAAAHIVLTASPDQAPVNLANLARPRLMRSGLLRLLAPGGGSLSIRQISRRLPRRLGCMRWNPMLHDRVGERRGPALIRAR